MGPDPQLMAMPLQERLENAAFELILCRADPALWAAVHEAIWRLGLPRTTQWTGT